MSASISSLWSVVAWTWVPSLSKKPQNSLCLMFLPNFSISFLIHFLELTLWISVSIVVSQFSSHHSVEFCRERDIDSIGEGGLKPRVRPSNGLKSLTVYSMLLGWMSLVGLACWSDWSSLGPLLESPNSNPNLPLLAHWTSNSIKDSGDFGIQPLAQLWPCMVFCLSSFKLSRLNMIAVVSLFDSESSNWGCWLCPFVIKGPLPSIQVYLTLDSVGREARVVSWRKKQNLSHCPTE